MSDAVTPLRLVKRRNAQRNKGIVSDGVTSKCTAFVDAQVRSTMYTLLEPLSLSLALFSRMYSGPAKSSQTFVNGGSSDTLLDGKSEGFPLTYGFPSALRHTTQFLIIFFTNSRPCIIQYLSRVVVNVSRIPLCFTLP